MPELPEVETVKRGLVPVLEGRVIAKALQRRADLRWPLPPRFAERLQGQRVLALTRRSKYLLAALDGGETWMIHLGMSGRMLVHHAETRRAQIGDYLHEHPAAETHDHVVVTTEAGTRVVFNDPRRFGAMDLWPTDEIEAHPRLASLGPEPFSNAFSPASLTAALNGRRTAIKAALLDQRIVAGLGNIYACEALFRAGVHPTRLSGSLTVEECTRLVAEIRATLDEAIAAGGSSLRDYRQADGELGTFQHGFRVYGREGEPCPVCGTIIERIVQSGRSTFYCPRCQS
ncbi:MAG: bifunctional DNA-formamidopyrimidine glycosylase/DNA-(apurinic or apyrimidinic site) lyase [Pseudomonadota bacterium]